jgi:hypothetical protein
MRPSLVVTCILECQKELIGADSGTVALALATGEASMPIPESVKVTFEGDMKITWISVMLFMLRNLKC